MEGKMERRDQTDRPNLAAGAGLWRLRDDDDAEVRTRWAEMMCERVIFE